MFASRACMIGAAMVAVLGCATVSLGQRKTGPAPQRAETQEAPLLGNITLPYVGHGSVVALDDGVVIIDIGREDRLDPETGDWSITDGGTVAFQLDTTGLDLIEDSFGEVFLDKDFKQINARALNSEDVRVKPFPRAEEVARQPTRVAIFTLTGVVALRFDRGTNSLSVAARNPRDPYRVFRHAAQLAVWDGNDRRFSENVVRLDASADSPWLILASTDASTTECSVSCRNGACSISCTGKRGCRAFCNDGYPVCQCIQMIVAL